MQQETSWDDARIMLGANGPDMAVDGRGPGGAATGGPSRTQDDARVGYYSQRPHPQGGGGPQAYSAGPAAASAGAKRWAPSGAETFVDQV